MSISAKGGKRRIAITKRSDTELEIVTHVMLDDQVRLTKTARSELQIVTHNPQGGINGTAMARGTVSAAAVARIKAWQ